MTPVRPVEDELSNAAEMLWVVLSNVSGSDWSQQTPEWQEAAARWRDNYFAVVSRLRAATPPTPEPRLFPNMTGPAVPWWLLAPCEARARQNHGGQTLERLAERGGLSACEIVALLENRSWRGMDQPAANARIVELLGLAAATPSGCETEKP